MGSGVAGQCSRNRCLARWTVWILYRGRGGAAGRANSKKDLVTGPIRGFRAIHHRQDPPSLRSQELGPGGTALARSRRKPRPPEDRADGGGADTDAELAELALDADASPSGVLPAETNDQVPDRGIERWAPEGPPPAIRPLPPHELAVPPEQGLGRHEEGGPPVPREQPTGHGDENSVHPPEPRSSDLSPEERRAGDGAPHSRSGALRSTSFPRRLEGASGRRRRSGRRAPADATHQPDHWRTRLSAPYRYIYSGYVL